MKLYAYLMGMALVLVASFGAAGPAAAEAAIDAEAALEERVLGEPDAPVTLIEYASLTCPHCASFHNETYPALKERYIDTGKVKLVYRDFPLDGVALRAAMMARCAHDERYFGLIQVLYKTQENWARAADPAAELAKVGRLAGIDAATFEACLASEELLDGVVRSRQQGAQVGVRSTPTFVINGELYPGARSLEEFAEIIEPLLADK